MKVSILEGFAGQSVRLAVLPILLVGLASVSQAQASGATAQATTKAAAAIGQVKAEPATAAPGKSPAKGNHEGITVHGHWMIEVRNPDGKVVSHTEFENSLVDPALLGAILTGFWVPGGYQVTLADSPTATTGPCQPATLRTPAGGVSLVSECLLLGSLISPTPALFSDQTLGCPGLPGQCFPLTITPTSTGFTVTGTATSVVAGDYITDVYLVPLTCNSDSGASVVSPSACAGGTTAGPVNLTHGTLPTPGVAITAVGQSIFVSVQISFASAT